MAIAYFDLDRTLLAANSGSLWLRRELKLGHLSWLQVLRAGTWVLRYQLGFASMEEAIRRAILHLKGIPEAEIRQRTAAFFDEQVRRLYRAGAQRALEAHRARGDRRVLLTASSSYLAELVARDLELDDVLCTRFEVDASGRHTGQSFGPLCFGLGKLEYATRYAQERGVDLSDCTFYTDSYSDLPVLLAVGHPVAVNPDVRLKRAARRRGWPVEHWGEPDAQAGGMDGAWPSSTEGSSPPWKSNGSSAGSSISPIRRSSFSSSPAGSERRSPKM